MSDASVSVEWSSESLLVMCEWSVSGELACCEAEAVSLTCVYGVCKC